MPQPQPSEPVCVTFPVTTPCLSDTLLQCMLRTIECTIPSNIVSHITKIAMEPMMYDTMKNMNRHRSTVFATMHHSSSQDNWKSLIFLTSNTVHDADICRGNG